MSEWSQVTIGECVEIKRGFAFKSSDYTNDGHFILRVSNLGEGGKVDIDDAVFLTPSKVSLFTNYQLEIGDILLVMVGATTGKIGRVTSDVLPALLNQNLWNLKPSNDCLYKSYFYFKLREIIDGFLSSSQGSAREFLKQSDLTQICFNLPPLLEQKKIARILTTVDSLIEKTEALIEKYKTIKHGMMHDLFTRGVDQNGKLRPPYEEAPHLYKESPLGWIPKEWEAKTLNDTISPSRPIVYGILMPGYGYPGGIPVIKVKDIKNGEVQTDHLLLTSPDIDNLYRRSKTLTGDLLFTIRGTVGRMAFVPEQLEGANITQDTARIGVVHGDPRFLRGYLTMPEPMRFVAVHTLGVAVQGINLGDVRRIPIAFPSIQEQEEIGHRTEVFERRLSCEQSHLEKLQILKKGLMHDLLTGKVRVNVDELEEELTNA